jgi:hypothetical protein
MTLNQPKLDQIFDALYEAAAIPDRWPRALAELSWGVKALSGHFAVWNKFQVTPNSPLRRELTRSPSISILFCMGPGPRCESFWSTTPSGVWLTIHATSVPNSSERIFIITNF